MGQYDNELSRTIFHSALKTMKFTLDLVEQHYEDGRKDPRFKFFKRLFMSETYDNLRHLFDDFTDQGLLSKIENEDLKNGYQENKSGGSGYVNTEDFNNYWTGEDMYEEDEEIEGGKGNMDDNLN